ncbi:MAG: hypothetical protein IKU43_00695 [Clostridia bacterium]|nr:hypothetical protein [Clostridia bacterium]
MKIRKILSAFLAVLMTASCMSVVAFAKDDEATLSAVEPIVAKVNNAGANDQRCTKQDNFVEEYGRTVQKIIPNASTKPTSNLFPAWIGTATDRQTIIDSGYAYKYIKIVYYTSDAASSNPTMTVFRNNNGSWASTGTGATLKSGTAAKAGKWQTAIFELPAAYSSDALYGFMFGVYGNEAVQNHVDATIYIARMAVYDTYENASADDNDFEGAVSISSVKLGGTALSGFSASTTTYNVDLKGAAEVPEITLAATGNTNNLKVEKTALDSTGKATATITADSTVYTINFTGGAVKTDIAPATIKIGAAGKDQGCAGVSDSTDPYGRAVQLLKAGDYTNNVSPATFLMTTTYPNARNSNYKVIKFVYYTSVQANPASKISVWADSGTNAMAGRGTAALLSDISYTAPGGGWNVAYYDLTASTINFAAGEFLYAYMFNIYGESGSKHVNDTIYFGDIKLFASVVDAKEHKSAFEGDIAVSSVKVDGTEIATAAGTYSYNAKGAAKVPAITLSVTGNTNNLVITEGKFDTAGNATTTVKDGEKTIVTVNFTGGEPRAIDPIIPTFQWAGAKDQGIASTTEITDDFSRTYKQYAPALTYFENGSDMVPTAMVSPGGDISDSMIPEGMTRNDYKAMKVVYRSPIDYLPKLSRYDASFKSQGQATAQYDVAPVKDKWSVVYFELPENFRYYQFYFTGDACTNHMGELFEIGYAGIFADMEDAKAHKSAFEGEFAISDVLLDGTSIGNVTTYTKDLAGAGAVPKLTLVASGDTEDVTITNGTIDAQGKATSTVKKGNSTIVTVNFTGASNEFKVTNILVDGKAIDGFNVNTKEYTMALGFAAEMPVVTYEYQGEAKTLAIDTVTTTENNVTTKYVTTIKDGDTVLYTITFNVDVNKPKDLLNTLYKLNVDKKLTVAYLGGSVTSGTGSTNSNTKSWRGITRDWLKSTFPNASVTEVNGAIGGTGAIFGVFRNYQQVLKTSAGAPDLLFVETVINDSYDGTLGNNSYIRYTESIIKQTLSVNPKCDIILVVTGDSGTFAKEAASDTPVTGLGYKALGELYDIPVVYVGFELAHQIKRDYGANFSTSSDGWKYYFDRNGSIDGVHPNDNGYAHYANTIINYMTPNLPTTYVPTAEDYVNKTNPENAYCEAQGLGSVMLDATIVNPGVLSGDKYLGGFTAASASGLANNTFKSTKEGDVISLEFNSSNFGIWTWSYGTANGKNGTDIKYSIDGGEIKTANIYRSYPNHKIYFLAQGLDNTKTHTIRIYHNDSANPFDVRWFLMWGMPEGEAASIKTVPYFDTAKDTYTLKVGGETFAQFNTSVKDYEIPVQLTAGQDYPKVEFSVDRANYYGYALTQASGENNVATLILDNVGTYTFSFVNGTAVEIESVVKADLGEKNGKAILTKAAEYAMQVKAKDADWSTAVEFPAGTTEITGLATGEYQVRYILEEGVYGSTKTFGIWTKFPYANVFYVTNGGNGDGSSADSPAGVANLMEAAAKAATFFGNKAKTETCYIVLVGNVIHSTADPGIDTTLYKDFVFTSEVGAILEVRAHIYLKAATANSGKTTFENVNFILGNPNSAQGGNNGEIMFLARANEVTLKEFNTVGYATNSYGETRTAGLCINYFADGASGATGTGKPLTIDSSKLHIASYRLTGWNKGNETGDSLLIFENGKTSLVKLGGHVNVETITGVTKAYINGGTVTTVQVSGDAALIHKGTVALVYNGGKVDAIKVLSPGDAEGDVDRIAILNNGMTSSITKTHLDYIIHSGVGGKADFTTASNRVNAFTFETEKEFVIINKGLASEKKYTAVDGKVTLTTAELPAGEYTVNYEDTPVVPGLVDVQLTVKLGREPGTAPKKGNELHVDIYALGDDGVETFLKTIYLEGEDTVTDEDGNLVIDAVIDVSEVEAEQLVVYTLKNGYFATSFGITKATFNEKFAEKLAGVLEGFENSHGDIKGSFDAEYGDGKIDLDDFIRVLRGFTSDANSDLKNVVDLNEDGIVNVQDLAIVKNNYGFDIFGN